MHGVDHVVEAADIQEGFLLTGKRRIWKVFSRCRRAHRNRYVATIGHVVPRLPHRFHQLLRERRIENPPANRGPGTRQRLNVVDIEVIEQFVDLLVEAVCGEKLAVGRCGGRKSSRDGYAQV